MKNQRRKNPGPMTGEQQRMSGVRHLYAAQAGQAAAFQAVIGGYQADVLAEPFKTRKPYWSK